MIDNKPHARGDEPLDPISMEVKTDINPTHVGMNRRLQKIAIGRKYKPHARGDEPSTSSGGTAWM